MSVKYTGLLERLLAKSVLGLPVETEDVLELAQIVTFNAQQLNALNDKVNQLAEQTGAGFTAMDESLAHHHECLEGLADVSDKLVDTVEMLDTDITGVYADLNELDPESEGEWERDSIIQAEAEAEAAADNAMVEVLGVLSALGFTTLIPEGTELDLCDFNCDLCQDPED